MLWRRVARSALWTRPHIAAALVAVVVAAFWAPTLWRSNLLNWHVQTSFAAAQICGWPAWQEGFTTLCTDDWYYRVLERRALKLPSTAWTSLSAHRWGSAALFYALPWALHAATAALVASIAQAMTGRVGLGVLAGLLFGLHPATAEVMVTGQFIQLVFGGFFSALALRAASAGRSVLLALSLALASLCDVSFVVMPLVVLLWVDDRRRWWRSCATILGLGGAAHLAHAWIYPGILTHHMSFPTMTLGERLLRASVIEPVLALRRLLLLWSPSSGPWYHDSPIAEFDGLGPFEPAPLLGLLALLGAGAWLGRRHLPTLAKICAVPTALFLIDVGLRAGLSDVIASRWSGLRNVYIPAIFLAVTVAWSLRGLQRRAWIGLGGAAALLWAGALAWTLADRTWTRMAADSLALDATAAALRPLALAPGQSAYLFGVADPRPFSIWQATLRDRLGDVRFVIVTRDDRAGGSSTYTRVAARELEVTIDPEHVDFLRPEAQPSWAGPLDPAESLTLYIRRGGQLNAWPIFDAGVLGGQWVPLPGIDGAAVRVESLTASQPARLRLRTALDLDDPRVVLLLDRHGGWARIPPDAAGQRW